MRLNHLECMCMRVATYKSNPCHGIYLRGVFWAEQLTGIEYTRESRFPVCDLKYNVADSRSYNEFIILLY